MKRALVTGITGQDGSHLAELLLSKGVRLRLPGLTPGSNANLLDSKPLNAALLGFHFFCWPS